MPPSRHASAALLTFTLLAFASCATSPEHGALAKVGDREITAGQLQEYAESLPAAARQGLETDAALLEAFILHRLLLLEAEAVAIQETPEFKEAFNKIVDWEARSLGLHEESGYLAKVDAERRRLLVKHMLRESASTGRDYEEFVTGLRQKYNVEVFAPDPAE